MPCTEAYKEHIMYTFHGFCKVVIRNAAITAWRDRHRQHKREIYFENKITISSGEGLGDTEVVLKPIEVKEENAYDEPAYLTPGMPVKMDVEKGAWFKVGISMQNETDTDITVYVEVEGVEVRIE